MSTIEQTARREQYVRENILLDRDPPPGTTAARVLELARSLKIQNVIMLIGSPETPNRPDPDRWPRWSRSYMPSGWSDKGNPPTLELQFRCSLNGVAETVLRTAQAFGFRADKTGALVTITL